MEIGPIARALLHNRSRFLLVALEIALTLAIVANCLSMIGDQRRKMMRPTGLDEENVLVIESKTFAPAFQEVTYARNVYQEDLRTLRALPGVHAATGIDSIPLSGGGSSTGRRAADSEANTIGMPYFNLGTQGLESLGVELVAGRGFIDSDYPQPGDDADGEDRPANVLLTQAAADDMFPNGDALGKQIEGSNDETPDTVVGIIRRMHGSWPMSPLAERVMLFAGEPFSLRRTRYLVRSAPGMASEVQRGLEETMLRVDAGRIIEVQSLADYKRDTYRELTGLNTLLGGVSVLIVAVTALGIVGLTSFSVTQRMRQIGTRRALGATRLAILRYVLVENWLITSFGLVAGVALTYGLNFALANLAEVPRIGFPLVGSGMVLLWLVGLLAALAPALRGAAVPPVVATRTV